MNYYTLLGIEPSASEEDIKGAYRRTVRLTSPATIADPVTPLHRSVQEAYEVLSDPDMRKEYDAAMRAAQRPSSSFKPVQAAPSANEDGGSFIPAMVPKVVVDSSRFGWNQRKFKDARTTPSVLPQSVLWAGVALLGVAYAQGMHLLFDEIMENSVSSLRALTMIAAWIGTGAASVLVLRDHAKALTSQLRVGMLIAVGSVIAATFFVVDPWIGTVIASIVAAAIIISFALRSKAARGNNVKGLIFPASVMERTVQYGNPGEALLQAAKKGTMPQRGAEQTAYGQKLTATVLGDLLAIPGARIIHGLKVPAVLGSDVDHAILCGDRLALIESTLMEPGRYELDQWGDIIVNGGTRPTRHSGFADAVKKAEISMKNLEISGWIVVHPSKEGEMKVIDSQTDNGVRLVDAQHLMEEVGAFLADGKKNNLLDARRMAQVWRYKMSE